MICYIESKSSDPYYNLALEQFIFDKLDRKNSYFMLWQNDNAVIVGKHQNTQEEINTVFVKEKNISVVRRLSGGGAVYHDLGNLNFTYITDAQVIDFPVFCEPVRQAISSFGVPVEFSGRNDMTVEGKKISGNAQYIKEGRIMHHGTILYDSELNMLSQALKPGDDKINSRSIKSIQSRVCNIRPYMKTDMSTDDFWAALRDYLCSTLKMENFILNTENDAAVEDLRKDVYTQWSWNYGNSPPYTLHKVRRIEGCGKIEIFLDIGQEGKIRNITFYGDFFGNRDLMELDRLLSGKRLQYGELKTALKDININDYFHNLDTETFLALIL
jgi:lipoate-protein ligase A